MRTVNAPFGSPRRVTAEASRRRPDSVLTRLPATYSVARASRVPFGARTWMTNARRLAQAIALLLAFAVGVTACEDAGSPRFARVPEQSPPPISAGPELWRRKIGSEIARCCIVTGSGWVVSPEAMNAQPRESIELVKKSPSRRSWPVATHVVPPWQTPLSWIGRPTASTVSTLGDVVSAPRMLAAWIEMFDFAQSRSTSLSLWYQTTLIRPASPAATHGQKARAPAGAATLNGGDHVLPRSLE